MTRWSPACWGFKGHAKVWEGEVIILKDLNPTIVVFCFCQCTYSAPPFVEAMSLTFEHLLVKELGGFC